jgi:hypothetical protein
VTEWYRVAVSKTTMDDVGGDVDSDCTAGCVRDCILEHWTRGSEKLSFSSTLSTAPNELIKSYAVPHLASSTSPRLLTFFTIAAYGASPGAIHGALRALSQAGVITSAGGLGSNVIRRVRFL